jgi:hypothetical protein
MRTSFPGLKVDGGDDTRRIALVVNNILAGRLNVILELDIAAGAPSTMVFDDRLTETVVPVAALGGTVNGYDWLSPGQAQFIHAVGLARVEPVVLIGG